MQTRVCSDTITAMPLTPKQARFIEEYVLDHNATAAALRAGFAPKSARVIACRLLKANKAVQEAVAAQEALLAAEVGMTRQRVVQGLLEAVEMARERQEPGAMIAAWRELGKMLGYYAPERVKVAVAEGRLNDFTLMSDESLQAIIDRAQPVDLT